MKRRLVVIAGLILAACGGNVSTKEMVRYDFGGVPERSGGAGSRVALATVEVEASSWLAVPDMHFRLAYAEPLQRRSYSESRWVAPPAELLEAFLKRRVVFSPAEAGAAGCRLQVALDELEQHFDDPQGSRMVLAVRAQLSTLRGTEILSRTSFMIRKPAASPDARGGAAAARDAVQALAGDIDNWLAEISRDKPAVTGRCRN